MCRQRPGFKPNADEKPCDTIGVQDKGLIASDARRPGSSLRRFVTRRLLRIKIRYIEACPLFFVLIPPAKLFPLAPRFSIRASRGAVVQNASIRRPGKAPAVAI